MIGIIGGWLLLLLLLWVSRSRLLLWVSAVIWLRVAIHWLLLRKLSIDIWIWIGLVVHRSDWLLLRLVVEIHKVWCA